MKRLVIMTVGKTHCGKTTFARQLEQKLTNTVVMDQDNHAEFINTHYANLQPKTGPNTLKHAISKLIVRYTIENTNSHLIICNANRNRPGRLRVLEEFFPSEHFIRVMVHFDIPDDVLLQRVRESQRCTNVFRGAYVSFEEVLKRQHTEIEPDPTEDEADYLFVIREAKESEAVMDGIVEIVKKQRRK